MRVAVALFVLLAVAVQAGAQDLPPPTWTTSTSTPTTLYFHVADFADMPINTQEPDGEETGGSEPVASTLTCLDPLIGDPLGLGAGAGCITSNAFHTWYGYSSPANVAYGGDAPLASPYRGLTYDAQLDPTVTPVLHWYLLATAGAFETPGQPPVPRLAAPLANVVVSATLRAGDRISIDDTAYNEGPVIASGRTPPATMLADNVQGGDGHVQAVKQVGDAWLYDFAVPLVLQQETIQRSTGYNVRIDFFMDVPECDAGADEALAPGTVAVHTSPGARPRLELATRNALRIDYVVPQVVVDDLLVHVSVGSAWGLVDLDMDSAQLQVTGPAHADFRLAAPVQRYNEHGRSPDLEPLSMTYVWQDGVHGVPGVYDVTFSMANRQGTANVSATATFVVEPRQEAPGPAAALGLAAILAVAALRRRRR